MAKMRRNGSSLPVYQSVLLVCLCLGFAGIIFPNAQPIYAKAPGEGTAEVILPQNISPLHSAQDVFLKAKNLSIPSTLPEVQNTAWHYYQEIPTTYERVAENEVFQLYANRDTLAFKVVDKRSGYIWHSNLDEVTREARLNKTWTAFAQSGISIDYLDAKALSKRASITNAEHTIDFQTTEQGFEAWVRFTDASITIKVLVELEPGGVRVAVPFESIKQENPVFKLGLLYVYPFLGATIEDTVPGYMFIPDGSGSIIQFAAETKAQNMYYGRYYGEDLGMLTTLPYDPKVNRPLNISIPVFGMVHGDKQNAFICIVEKGASYGEIQAHPAGIITRFNFIYNAFIYNESYFQATNRSGAGVTVLQQKTNEFDITIHYRFLTKDEGDYVGMAKAFQKYLIEKGVLKKIAKQNDDISIRLEFLGGEKEKILFWNRLIPMTTVDQMAEILDGLDVKNPEVIYYGWQPLGASTMAPQNLKLDRGLGSLEQLKSLVEKIKASGGNFYLYLDLLAALVGEKGYSSRYDLAMSITNFNIQGYNRNKVNYYLNFDAVSKRYVSLSKDVFAKLNAGLALDGIGPTLYSDFKKGNELNREKTIARYQGLLSENPGSTSFYLPNDYLFAFAQAYYDIPLSDNGYIYMTEEVPFIQIVLAGYIPYYGTALNFSSNNRDDLLKHADFGIYPSYFLSYEATANILNTRSSWIYTSSYSQWKKEIEKTYHWLNDLLRQVKGEEIVARETLAEGVVATTYANGKQIIVNYSGEAYNADGFVVTAKNAVIVDVGEGFRASPVVEVLP